MKPRQPYAGLLCPLDGSALLDFGEPDGRLRCIHQGHDGRPTTHPLGAAPMTKSVFSLDEVLRASRTAVDHADVQAAVASTAEPVATVTPAGRATAEAIGEAAQAAR